MRLATGLARVNQVWLDFLAWASSSDEEQARGYGQIVAHADRAAYKLLGVSLALIANPKVIADDIVLEIWLTNPTPRSADIGPWYLDSDRKFFAALPNDHDTVTFDAGEAASPRPLLDFLSDAVLASEVFQPSAPTRAGQSCRRETGRPTPGHL